MEHAVAPDTNAVRAVLGCVCALVARCCVRFQHFTILFHIYTYGAQAHTAHIHQRHMQDAGIRRRRRSYARLRACALVARSRSHPTYTQRTHSTHTHSRGGTTTTTTSTIMSVMVCCVCLYATWLYAMCELRALCVLIFFITFFFVFVVSTFCSTTASHRSSAPHTNTHTRSLEKLMVFFPLLCVDRNKHIFYSV